MHIFQPYFSMEEKKPYREKVNESESQGLVKTINGKLPKGLFKLVFTILWGILNCWRLFVGSPGPEGTI